MMRVWCLVCSCDHRGKSISSYYVYRETTFFFYAKSFYKLLILVALLVEKKNVEVKLAKLLTHTVHSLFEYFRPKMIT